MEPPALWRASELDIDEFYKQLREEIAAGYVYDDKDRGIVGISP